eukprot:61097-Prymnesium_polylepis.1
MPPKKKVADRYPPLSNQLVHGWPFRVDGKGTVTVGTDASGLFMRWTFSLNTYPDDSADPAACVIAEIDDRRRPERASKIGRMTPLLGPKAAEERCSETTAD